MMKEKFEVDHLDLDDDEREGIIVFYNKIDYFELKLQRNKKSK